MLELFPNIFFRLCIWIDRCTCLLIKLGRWECEDKPRHYYSANRVSGDIARYLLALSSCARSCINTQRIEFVSKHAHILACDLSRYNFGTYPRIYLHRFCFYPDTSRRLSIQIHRSVDLSGYIVYPSRYIVYLYKSSIIYLYVSLRRFYPRSTPIHT